MNELNMTYSNMQGSIICLYENLIPLNRDVQIVPVGYLG
jgi:hypothetical protein